MLKRGGVRTKLAITPAFKEAFHREVDEIRWGQRHQRPIAKPSTPFVPGCGPFCSIHPKKSLNPRKGTGWDGVERRTGLDRRKDTRNETGHDRRKE